jgi:hypothetical protein
MNLITYLLLSVTAGPQVEVSTLSGAATTGELKSLSATELVIVQEGKDRTIPLANLLELQLKPSNTATTNAGSVRVRLADGTSLTCQDVAIGDKTATLTTALYGTVTVPSESLLSIRLSPPDSSLTGKWEELLKREIKRDLLVMPKDAPAGGEKRKVLDFLDGSIAAVDKKQVKFLLDGTAIPIPRERLYGLVFAKRKTPSASPICETTLVGGDSIAAKSISYSGAGAVKVTLLTGGTIDVPADKLRTLDFSLGKVRYLSRMDPREVKYTPYFDLEWKYQRDRNRRGGPLRIGDKTYQRGLWIHSKTYLRYRLSGEYRRFKAVIGIDHEVAAKGGDVHVVISVIKIGDQKKILLETDVRGSDKPRELDLDVSGARELEILVDFGKNLDIADHLDLGDARVLK